MEQERRESANSEQQFDLVVIGAGPGGYVAAIRAAQLGLRVAVCERDHLGGTCLNWGCIPTKCYAASARSLEGARGAAAHGLDLDVRGFDFGKVHARKEGIVENLRKGIEQLFKKRKITLFRGLATMNGPETITVEPAIGQGGRGSETSAASGDKITLRARRIILATGTKPMAPGPLAIDGRFVLDSTGLLALDALPESLAIVGGGVIGCEFASALSTFGVKVTVIEALPRLLPREDRQVSNTIRLALRKSGVEIKLGSMVKGVERDAPAPSPDGPVTAPADEAVPTEVHGAGREAASGVLLTLEDGSRIWAAKALVAIGRSPDTMNLGLEAAGVETGGPGYVPVNSRMETNVPGIYAVGDLTGQHFLAHTASHGGLVAAANAAAALGVPGIEPVDADFSTVPNCIFTEPEIASVGATEEELKESGCEYAVGRFPMAASGKAQASGHAEGFVKILSSPSDGKLLGCHIVGPGATDLIAEAALARRNGLTVSDIAHTIHAHPTLAESLAEAAEAALGMPIHTFAALALFLAASLLATLLIPAGLNPAAAQRLTARQLADLQSNAARKSAQGITAGKPLEPSLVASLKPARGDRDSLDRMKVDRAIAYSLKGSAEPGQTNLIVEASISLSRRYVCLIRGKMIQATFEADENLGEIKKGLDLFDADFKLPVVDGVSIELPLVFCKPHAKTDNLTLHLSMKGRKHEFQTEIDYVFNRRLGAAAPKETSIEGVAAFIAASERDEEVCGLIETGEKLVARQREEEALKSGQGASEAAVRIEKFRIDRSLTAVPPYLFFKAPPGYIVKMVDGESGISITATGRIDDFSGIHPVSLLLGNSEFRNLRDSRKAVHGSVIFLVRQGGAWQITFLGVRDLYFEVKGDQVTMKKTAGQ